MVLRLLLLPVTGPVMGLSWIGEKILEQANTEIELSLVYFEMTLSE